MSKFDLIVFFSRLACFACFDISICSCEDLVQAFFAQSFAFIFFVDFPAMTEWGFAAAMLEDATLTPKKAREILNAVRMIMTGVLHSDINISVWFWFVRNLMCFCRCRFFGHTNLESEWERAVSKPPRQGDLAVSGFSDPDMADLHGPLVAEVKSYLNDLNDRPSSRYMSWTNDLTALLHDLSRLEAAMSQD